MSTLLKNNEIWLYGTVGKGVADGEDGFTAIAVRDALAEIGNRDVTVRLNSGGGWSHEGIAIHSQLSAHPGKVTVVVEGVAASAASVLAMAGQEIIMRPGASIMVHEASGITIGNAKDHRKMIEALETVNRSMVDIYVKRTRRPVVGIRREMAAETWMTADEAVSKKYADRVDAFGTAQKPASFAWKEAYCHAPTQIAAMAGTAKLSERFAGAVAAAASARDEAAIEGFIRRFYPRRTNDPGMQQALAQLRTSYPEAVGRALSRPANVLDGPWRRVVDRQNATLFPGT